jgi:hypothetical protein
MARHRGGRFGLGIAGDGHSAGRIVLAVIYALTVIPGMLLGLRTVANAPLDTSKSRPAVVAPIGVLALAPLGTGLVLAILLSMFGHNFIGEHRARGTDV